MRLIAHGEAEPCYHNQDMQSCDKSDSKLLTHNEIAFRFSAYLPLSLMFLLANSAMFVPFYIFIALAGSPFVHSQTCVCIWYTNVDKCKSIIQTIEIRTQCYN